ncbi:PadR family transcriptional regulator [Kineococcus glutinatus]|uniref:PadR family transcriptional regulator n=1 Tax=Kineococcus glutinatus TaxID=1070872 RepID=A0ABP9I3H9_9ACTN
MLVLGVVRIAQPVHGYDVRRELLSWRLEEWANVKPGSVYSALKTMHREGLLALHGEGGGGGRPERTRYVLTGEGEKEFQVLLRAHWWHATSPTVPFLGALCLMPFMAREELVAALTARISQLGAKLDELRFVRETVRDGATGADGDIPEHAREVFEFAAAHTRGELDWTRALLRRVQAGAYVLAGEPGAADLGPGRGVLGPVEGLDV